MTNPKRRWFQFSIRGLLILTLVVGAYFAGFATSQKLAEKERREAEQKAAAELEAARAAATDVAVVRTLGNGKVKIWNLKTGGEIVLTK